MTDLARAAHHQVGAIRVTTVADGLRRMPVPDGLVTNATKAEVSAALAQAGLPPDELVIHFNPVVIDTAGGRALVDTGFGAAAGQAPGATTGLLLQSLEQAGIDPDSIDTVVISHFHGDHVGGLVTPEGGPAFPRARVLVPAPEWAFWMDDAAMKAAEGTRTADTFALNRTVFAAVADQVSQYGWGEEVLPGVVAEGTPGHTSGHTSFHVRSGGQSLFVQSDVTNNPALFVTHPGWRVAFDTDGAQAEATRRRVYDRAVAERTPVQGFHFPFPSRGMIEVDGEGYRLVPID